MLSTLTLFYDYHYWMTARLLQACEALTPAQWSQQHGHSWESVHGLVAHMLGAEIIWIARWQGTSLAAMPGAADFPTLADIRARWMTVEAEVRAFLAACDDTRLAQPFNYFDTKGRPYTIALGPVMLHVANHGTHHRGELVAMLALMNVPHPEDDLLRYLFGQPRPLANDE